MCPKTPTRHTYHFKIFPFGDEANLFSSQPKKSQAVILMKAKNEVYLIEWIFYIVNLNLLASVTSGSIWGLCVCVCVYY